MLAKSTTPLDEHYGKELKCLVGGCELTLIYLYSIGDSPSRSLYMDRTGIKYQLRNSKRHMTPTGERISEDEIAKICASAFARSRAERKETRKDVADSA